VSGEGSERFEEHGDGELEPPTAELGIAGGGALAPSTFASSNGHAEAADVADIASARSAPWERPELLLAAAFLTGLLLAAAFKRRRG
jgi:hypothetical protein